MCKFAHDIISERSVWEQALHLMYQRDSLFEPSFQPLPSMDMYGLRKAALRPHQFQSRIRQASAMGTLRPSRDRTLGAGVDGLHGEDFIRAQIIPGGRYIIGLADTFICLWDMGPPGPPRNPLSSSIQQASSPTTSSLCQPRRSRRKIHSDLRLIFTMGKS